MLGLIAAMLLSGAFLFFEDQLSALVSLLSYDQSRSIDRTGQTLKLAYLFAPQSLDPYSTDPAALIRLHDVYEGLVAIDENLTIEPALAVSYGLIGDRIWEIKLRQGVTFHDGTQLEAGDIIYSFDQAKTHSTGPVADLMASVESYEQIDAKTVKIATKLPDPLFLNKLAKMPVIPSGFSDFSKPIGTGAYMIADATDLSDIAYLRNEAYWGDLPYFEKVEVKAITSKNDRVNNLLNGGIDFLVNVPPDAVVEIEGNGFKVDKIPSLEVGFVMFNVNDRNFSQVSIRRAVAQGLNKDSFLDLAMGYAKTINQFIPNGVFGYNPDLKGFAYNPGEAEKEIGKSVSSFEKLKIKFFYPESLKLLGQYFKEQLILIGLDTELHPLSDQELQEKIQSQELPFYYLGWRNDSGDALPFLKSVLHSRTSDYGIYNGMAYKNEKVDRLIEKSEINLNLGERLKDMQEVMRIVIDEDVIGVPLFETQSLFAYRSDLIFNLRLDSLVYPSHIRKK